MTDKKQNEEYVERPIENYRLIEARTSKGFNKTEFAERIGISRESYYAIEKLRTFPSEKYRKDIARKLGLTSRYLFPDNLRTYASEKNCTAKPEDVYDNLERKKFRMREIKRIAVCYDDERDSEIDLKDLNKRMEYILDNTGIPERERKVIRFRYGFYGKPTSLEETAKMFKITRDRVRQVEAKAIKQLQHPVRMGMLWEFI